MAYYSWESIITGDECDAVITEFDACNYEEAFVGKEDYKTLGKVRSTAVHWVKPTKMINRMVYGFILDANNRYFKYNISEYETLQFGKYKVGDFYEWHQDDQIVVDPLIAQVSRKLSATVLLSDPDSYEGGELEFYCGTQNPVRPEKSKGTVIVFDSSDWHRVTPVTKGVRYSLVMWANGPMFK